MGAVLQTKTVIVWSRIVQVWDHMEYETKPTDGAAERNMAGNFGEKNWVQVQIYC